VPNRAGSGLSRDEIERTLGIAIVEVERRRHDAAVNRQGADRGLDRTRAAEQVAHRALGRAHPQLIALG
jgi:hypothetical protein